MIHVTVMIIKVKMNLFQSAILTVLETTNLEDVLPKLKEVKALDGVEFPEKKVEFFKKAENDQSKIAGKYFKDLGQVDRSMVSDQDRKKGEEREQIRAQNRYASSVGTSISRAKFEKLFNRNGERRMKLQLDDDKIINSKDTNFVARLLPDGRVLLRRVND